MAGAETPRANMDRRAGLGATSGPVGGPLAAIRLLMDSALSWVPTPGSVSRACWRGHAGRGGQRLESNAAGCMAREGRGALGSIAARVGTTTATRLCTGDDNAGVRACAGMAAGGSHVREDDDAGVGACAGMTPARSLDFHPHEHGAPLMRHGVPSGSTERRHTGRGVAPVSLPPACGGGGRGGGLRGGRGISGPGTGSISTAPRNSRVVPARAMCAAHGVRQDSFTQVRW